ncbi:MAG: glycosyltransferase family 4 protein [Myxococcales bacterium]|nr:glycosyltransferase family 4 protein [Myxococcales bacterium]
MSTLAGRSLLFVVNTEWFFVSHRLPLARAALEANARVTLAAGGDGEALRATAEGRAIRFVPTPLSRSGVNPLRELGGVLTLRRLYQRERPDLVHHVTSKPVIYGSLAARGLPLTVLNAVSGLGYAFTGRGSSPRRAVLRATMQRLYRAALHRPRTYTVFQNQDDLELFIGLGLVDAASTLMIRGSGVDCRRFAPRPEPPGVPVVVLPSRLLRDKGVEEFVAAARLLRRERAPARLVLVGKPDPGNPSSIAPERVAAWQREGVIEWWGHSDDMPETLARAHVVALPSHREGLPKILLEAAASGRALVATDVPGCREVCLHRHNGLLVPPHDPAALGRAIATLAGDAALRAQLGARGRALALAEFSIERVVAAHMEVYRALLDGRPGPRARAGGSSAPREELPLVPAHGPAQAVRE